MSDYLNPDVNELPNANINITASNPDNVIGRNFYPVNGILDLHSTLRLFPRWVIDVLANKNCHIDVLGNKTSDMEMSSIVLYCQLNGHDKAWKRYGDLALYDEKLGWVQYWIHPDAFLDCGNLILTPDRDVLEVRNSIDYTQAELIFQKTRFFGAMDFPWYFSSIKGTDKFNPEMVKDFYVKQSSSKFKLTYD